MSETVHLLWTGGWDSTFRILELLHERDAVIQPHYIIDPARSSNDVEQNTMDRIKQMLDRSVPSAGDRLLPVIVTHLNDIPADNYIAEALDQLRAERHVGKQYGWLARYARHIAHTTLELNIEKTDKATELVKDHLVPVSDGVSRYRIAVDGGAITTLFRDFFFPLADLDKPRMRQQVDRWRMAAVMGKTWFCYHPLPGGYACGTCRPCVYVMDKGQTWRMGILGRVRYRMIERTRRKVPTPVKNWLRERAGKRIRRWLRT